MNFFLPYDPEPNIEKEVEHSSFNLNKIGKPILFFLCFLVLFIFCQKIISRIERNKYYNSITSVSVTIPEGFNVNQISDAFTLKLKNFNKNKFLLQTKGLEGYLFPDTYYFLNNMNEVGVIKSMSENFNKKVSPLLPQIVSSGRNEKDIIIMASVLEREAKGDVDRGVISGILWKRISLGMPLEVDSAPETYKTKGLPANPICNPGIESIKAAINIKNSPYLYYLHDKNGIVHYAKNYTEHQANIKKYLK